MGRDGDAWAGGLVLVMRGIVPYSGVDQQMGGDGIVYSGFHLPLLEGVVLICSTVPGWPALLQLPLDELGYMASFLHPLGLKHLSLGLAHTMQDTYGDNAGYML